VYLSLRFPSSHNAGTRPISQFDGVYANWGWPRLPTRQDRSPKGRRDLAISTLLATYGLRAGEITALRLDDIDWRREQARATFQDGPRDMASAGPAFSGALVPAVRLAVKKDSGDGRTIRSSVSGRMQREGR
jgi:hypothetical protein